jgi:hypothetical protein
LRVFGEEPRALRAYFVMAQRRFFLAKTPDANNKLPRVTENTIFLLTFSFPLFVRWSVNSYASGYRLPGRPDYVGDKRKIRL